MKTVGTDPQLIDDYITSLRNQIADLEQKRDLVIKRETLSQSIQAAHKTVGALQEKIEKLKTEIEEVRYQKAKMLEGARDEFERRITSNLPFGNAVVEILEDRLFIAWRYKDGSIHPYGSLSGGERIAFDLALSYAMLEGAQTKILIAEAAEQDPTMLTLTLTALKRATEKDKALQVVVSTWIDPAIQGDQDVLIEYIGRDRR